MAPEYTAHSASLLQWDYSMNLWSVNGVKSKLHLATLFKDKEVEIDIHHHYASKVYAPGTPVVGDVVITPRKDAPFEDVKIALIGRSRVIRQDVELAFEASHLFLDVDMPVCGSSLPADRVFRSGNTYTIPFHFVMPGQLPSSACTHQVESDLIRRYHMRMPPSMGGWERDDMTPDMARIEYSVRAAVLTSAGSGLYTASMVGGSRPLNFLPAAPEEPPLDISEHDMSYAVTSSKKIRNNIFSPAQGRITVSAMQPRAILYKPDGYGTTGSEIFLNVEFESFASSPVLPTSSTVSAKLGVETWYHDKPMVRLPELGTGRGAYSTSIPLLSKFELETSWEKVPLGEKQDSSSPGCFFTSLLRIPLELQTSRKILLPTFHSCLLSRTYKLYLSVRIGKTVCKLSVPLQVASELLVEGLGTDNGMQFHDQIRTGSMGVDPDNDLFVRDSQSMMGKVPAQSILPTYEETA